MKKKNLTEVLGVIAFIIAIMILPIPSFDNHTIWDDLWGGDVGIEFLRSDNETMTFQVTNNYPFNIKKVQILADFLCIKNNKTEEILLSSELTTLAAGESEKFYISNEEHPSLLFFLDPLKYGELEYYENIGDYPISFTTKNKNVYLIDYNGEISKKELNDSFSIYDVLCKVDTTLSYSYKRFGKDTSNSKKIKELETAPKAFKLTSFEESEVGLGSYGSAFIPLCLEYCEDCNGSPDWLISQFCSLWFCEEIKKQHPNDLISCLGELIGRCVWPITQNDSPCINLEKRLRTECVYYKNDECQMCNL